MSMLVMSVSVHAIDGLLTNEDVVATILQSSQLKSEKNANAYLSSMFLKSISIEADAQKKVNVVSLKYSNGGAPCFIRAEVSSSDAVPNGASGFGMKAEVTKLESVCALN